MSNKRRNEEYSDFENDEEKTSIRFVGFKGQDPELTISQPIDSHNRLQKVSVNFRTRVRRVLDIHKEYPSGIMENHKIENQLRGSNHVIDQFADSTLFVVQRWRNLFDLVELDYNSVSFFVLKKKQTPSSRWLRVGKGAARVGRGLFKNEKAQKLVLEHWLELIDVQHRYGQNLRLYFIEWFRSSTMEPFFYWLDKGEGKDLNLLEKCPRLQLQQQCIKYLDDIERKAYEVIVEDGKLYYKQSRKILETTGEPDGVKWIFVLSTSKELYIGRKTKGAFHHSSFLAGEATSAAGRIIAEKGIIKELGRKSGHYRPTEENFQDFLSFLREKNLNVTHIKLNSLDDKEPLGQKARCLWRNNSLDDIPDDILVIQKDDPDDSTLEKVAVASAELSSQMPS
ncbi:Hypothetical predicted protein [Olea europaea subsp. europaea]|uniref:IQ domain-containing protein IQM3-like n=1 Tax=Olea europaea subsp. europaea TaxID=158383 RepID=A0A8S0P7J9_OLEEU|nr:Hypothetical predicted protein [Olea europaea subsp. europaea]